jgi:hypothetical protein
MSSSEFDSLKTAVNSLGTNGTAAPILSLLGFVKVDHPDSLRVRTRVRTWTLLGIFWTMARDDIPVSHESKDHLYGLTHVAMLALTPSEQVAPLGCGSAAPELFDHDSDFPSPAQSI